MTFEELQMNLNLVFDVEDKKKILDAVAKNCDEGYFFVDDEGECYLFNKSGDLDDVRKIKTLSVEHIKKDIKKIKIPDSVAEIEYAAFSWCSNMKSVTIPDHVTSIWNFAFSYCNNLTNVIISNSVTSIRKWTFYSCKNLKELIFKGKTLDEVKSMNYYPFGIEDESIIKCEG